MNEIKVGRLILAGLALVVVWIAVEILVEQIMGRTLFGNSLEQQWLGFTNLKEWSGANHLVNLAITLLNSTMLVWLYASLRPMYGVGVRTALITSFYGIIWGFSLAVNGINLGLFPAQAILLEIVFEAIESPIAMIVAAAVYEGKGARATV